MNTRKPLVLGVSLLTSSFAFSAQNYIQDGQFTEYRDDNSRSDVWISHEGSDDGLGDVGSSGSTAFGEEGSARLRFIRKIENHDFTAQPGLSQVVTGLPTHTELTYSLYVCDQKGTNSQTRLYFGVRTITDDDLLNQDAKDVVDESLSGALIKSSRVHNSEFKGELSGARKGDVKKCFRQVSLDFNTGAHTNVEVFALLDVHTTDVPDLSKELAIRVDEFVLTEKN